VIIQVNKLSRADFKIASSERERNWMEKSSGNPYRCLPLTIANQFGWNILCPFNFKATWNGDKKAENAFNIIFDKKYDYSNYIASHFGDGILTFSLPYIFRTEKFYGLFVRGPINHIKFNVTYLDAFVETDWLNFTFTYNIKFQKPNIEVEFEENEPLLSFFPYKLEDLENIEFKYNSIYENPELLKNYNEYSDLRIEWNKKVKDADWMKDYHKADKAKRKQIGCPFLNSIGKFAHFTKLNLNNPNEKN